ncbi:MAG: hypothetical protein E7236_01180 [Lachnospiraceae bacterium]|nr:hypothetical protein [Lachnospiraceae bacterium]
MAAEIILGGFLGLLSLEDLKKQEVSFGVLGVTAGTGLIILISRTFTGWPDLLFRLLPGAGLLLFAMLSRGKVGTGDGMVFLAIGLYCTFDQVISLMVGAFLTSLVTAVVLLTVRKKKKTDTFPFVPCIFLAYMTGFVLHMNV